jgi:HEPN domain-containing protein
MALDPIRVEDTRAWLTKAAEDLRGAEVDMAATPPLLNDAAFHCQQAAEKAFKAFLFWHDVPFRRTHLIDEIGAQCTQVDPSLQPTVDAATPLSNYAWQFRYPSDDPSPTVEEAAAHLALAREVVAAIHARLPAETHP